jgi:hypothetical protein
VGCITREWIGSLSRVGEDRQGAMGLAEVDEFGNRVEVIEERVDGRVVERRFYERSLEAVRREREKEHDEETEEIKI